jgi:putative membrane protein
MIDYDRNDWVGVVLSIRGTALRYAARRVIVLTLFAVVVQCVYETGVLLGWPHMELLFGLEPTELAVLGSLLGFLIVFRMNASNNRYWEGRTHWGQIINSSRNLVRVGVEYTDEGDELADLVSGYAISLRRSLQGNMDTEETEIFLSEDLRRQASRFGNPPTALTAAISEWIGRNWRAGKLNSMLVRQMEDQLSKIVDAQGGCERIRKTPLPFAYVVMIKQLILIYLLSLPIAVCNHCGWWSPVLVCIVAIGLFGMEEASVEIEDPFGTLENCLDMGTYTITIARDVGQLAARKAGGMSTKEFSDIALAAQSSAGERRQPVEVGS